MVSLDPKLNNLFGAQQVGGVNPFAPAERVQYPGGEVDTTSGKGWEKYHTGQGPNGLKGGFLSDGTGENGKHMLNLYS